MIIPEFPSFAISIPTLNRWDLLMPTLHLYLADFPNVKIFVLDNGQQPCDVMHPNIEYIKQPENIGVARSWNKLSKLVFEKHDYNLVMNDDVYLGKKEHDIQNLLHYHGQSVKLMTALKNFCVFILPKKTYEWIGDFDEKFMAYYEDNDYTYRLELKGFKPSGWGAISPLVYRDNSTGEKNPEVYKWALEGKKYYVQKWGGLPGQEKFKTPFNQKSK